MMNQTKKTEIHPPAIAATRRVPNAEAVSAPGPRVRLKNVLVPLDFTPHSFKSLEYAVTFAAQFGAKLTLVHVLEPQVYTPELIAAIPLDPERWAAAEQELEEIRAARIPQGVPVQIDIRTNFALDGILDAARELAADLIITTTHGYTGLKHLLLGSTAENIVRRAPCPVLVVREKERDFA